MSAVSEPLVRITDLEVGYVRRRRTAPAVRGVNLEIAAGEVVALVGESGSGKSTIANTLIGLLPDNARVTGGSVVVTPQDGEPSEVVGAKERSLLALRGAVIGLVPQDPMVGLNPTRRVGGQVAEAVRQRGVRGPRVDVEVLEFLGRAGLDEPVMRARQYPHELSGGLRQRVLIAIALAGRPQLIIADEPTSALDVTVQRRILDHLESLVRDTGTSLLIITHDLAVAADRSDRVIVLRDGRIVEQGVPGEILVDTPRSAGGAGMGTPRSAGGAGIGTPRSAGGAGIGAAQDYTRRLIAAAPGLANGGRIVPRFTVTRDEAPDPDPVLRLESVRRDYPLPRGSGGGVLRAVDDVSLQLAHGRTHALVGESGSGKTTTLRLALGLEQPTSGRVVLGGTDLTGLGWRDTRPLRRAVQLVHQNPFASLDPRFTVKESIAEPLVSFRVGDRRSRAARARALLDQVALPAAYADRLPAELSGGQRQRVAIARALALEPRAVLLDEPVSALDVSVQDQILTLLLRLQEELGLSYLFVSHDLAVVAQVSHTVSVLRRGVVVEEGPVAEVFGAPAADYTRELIAAIPGQRLMSERVHV